MAKIKVIAVVGPTASGKTKLGIDLALHYGGEIVSADSMQVYTNMPIASAAPTEEEMQGVKHHLVGIIPSDRKFSVAEFIKCADKSVKDILSRGKLPIIVGGTGLYIDSFLNGIAFSEENSDEVRQRLEQEADDKGIEVLFERLKEIDPEVAQKLHLNDRKRIIRALEVYELHGKSMTEINALSKTEELPYEVIWLGLNYRDRQTLYDRINKRVDIMLQNGLLNEAESTYTLGSGKTAVQAIGHKEFFDFFDGKISVEEATERLKTETRRYAKRQLTWFRRNENINWIFADETEDVLTEAIKIVDSK